MQLLLMIVFSEIPQDIYLYIMLSLLMFLIIKEFIIILCMIVEIS